MPTTPAHEPGQASQPPPTQLPAFETTLTTRAGRRVHLRRAEPEDAATLRRFFRQLSPEDRHRRFLSAAAELAPDQLDRMVDSAGRDATFLVLDQGPRGALAAVATLARFDDLARAEVAISVRSDLKGQGIGWTVLNALMVYARAHGVQLVESVEAVDNLAALTLERELGFAIRACPDDPNLRLAERSLTDLATRR